jgi:hypothetical protein
MKPKKALFIVFIIVLFGEAVADLLAEHRSLVTGLFCVAIFVLVIHSYKNRQAR